MRHLKFGVVVCALLGLVGAFLPYTPGDNGVSFFQLREIPGFALQVFMTLGGFVAALVVGAIAVVRPPMVQWQGIVAVVGFAWVVVKLRDGFTSLIVDGAIGAKLIGIMALSGLALSILCVAKPEASSRA